MGLFLVTRQTALASSLDGGLDAGNVLVLSDGTVPTIESCPPPFSFNVRSSVLAPQPFTVTGILSRWLGRMAIPPPTPAGKTVFQAGENTTPQLRPVLETKPRRRHLRHPADPGGLSASSCDDQIQYLDATGDVVTDAGRRVRC